MVVTTAKGVWPRHIEENRVIWMNGKTGTIIDSKTFGLNGYPSPLIFDINNDGLDDIYLTANQKPDQLYLNLGDLKFKK